MPLCSDCGGGASHHLLGEAAAKVAEPCRRQRAVFMMAPPPKTEVVCPGCSVDLLPALESRGSFSQRRIIAPPDSGGFPLQGLRRASPSYRQRPEDPPCGVCYGTGQLVVPGHPGHVQIFQHRRLALTEESGTELVQEIQPLVGHRGMGLGQLQSGRGPIAESFTMWLTRHRIGCDSEGYHAQNTSSCNGEPGSCPCAGSACLGHRPRNPDSTPPAPQCPTAKAASRRSSSQCQISLKRNTSLLRPSSSTLGSLGSARRAPMIPPLSGNGFRSSGISGSPGSRLHQMARPHESTAPRKGKTGGQSALGIRYVGQGQSPGQSPIQTLDP